VLFPSFVAVTFVACPHMVFNEISVTIIFFPQVLFVFSYDEKAIHLILYKFKYNFISTPAFCESFRIYTYTYNPLKASFTDAGSTGADSGKY
jgi:hypothetical protein